MAWMTQDHPIFTESIRRIRIALGDTGLPPLEQQVLERLVHSSGDLSLGPLLHCSEAACTRGMTALQQGASILTDTAMAAAAVVPMARRTLGSAVHTVLEWAPDVAPEGSTRTAAGMEKAWRDLSTQDPPPVVLIGSAPTALDVLLRLVEKGARAPSLVIGMPVGFVGVAESKRALQESRLQQIRLEGSRGGAGLAAATVNALLRASTDACVSTTRKARGLKNVP
ncbi:precorrin-8X methylmutase [Synechococcus sp. PROS-U-1]|uniref:precorrin-8X methylmutase n=1 Tax=Synechococcus sp. PROS-U-1 TaxID=1400866 RepID=UPI0016472F91|nr:precorrin-8X methylmutase [Synechococcus sp. PROS-U-1]